MIYDYHAYKRGSGGADSGDVILDDTIECSAGTARYVGDEIEHVITLLRNGESIIVEFTRTS